ncbi:MAG: hypothetical protein IOC52_08350 [Methylobacterium sp.]|nr:hypothetical protein [Methylobacterium sp.]
MEDVLQCRDTGLKADAARMALLGDRIIQQAIDRLVQRVPGQGPGQNGFRPAGGGAHGEQSPVLAHDEDAPHEAVRQLRQRIMKPLRLMFAIERRIHNEQAALSGRIRRKLVERTAQNRIAGIERGMKIRAWLLFGMDQQDRIAKQAQGHSPDDETFRLSHANVNKKKNL